jgi:hypothetical protein
MWADAVVAAECESGLLEALGLYAIGRSRF